VEGAAVEGERFPGGGWPAWFEPLAGILGTTPGDAISRFRPPPGHHRRSAVLMLFGEGEHGPDVLLTERSATLRSHAGQVSFPGGALDPGDDGPVGAALREAREETGVDPDGVVVAGMLPDLYLPVSDFAVTPVLAWWRDPMPVLAVDPAEVAKAVRVPVAALTDPENRFRWQHPSGYIGPGFRAGGLFVWGFTAGILDRILHLSGWERPWDHGRLEHMSLQRDPSVEPSVEPSAEPSAELSDGRDAAAGARDHRGGRA
jgi:8-oxo-dGTP pyrophosphatase MutT (NUDIX family)